MMWELIAANRRKSIILFCAMGICLLAIGYFAGATFDVDGEGLGGLFIALGVWGLLSVVAVFGGGSILLASSRAREVTQDMHPQLYNIVEEMKISANLPAMPKIYIMEDPSPNAFATGFKPEKSAIAVTSGLLSKLNRDELQGVVAHEMSHIMNRDVQFMTLAGVMLGSIVLISEVFLRGLWFTGGGRRSRVDTKGGGHGHIAITLIAIAIAILAPVMARIFYFAISRKREYLADASAVRLTRYPDGLASALEKISMSGVKLSAANKVTAPMYIVNPLAAQDWDKPSLMSTHPPIGERVKILRSMSQGADYLSYQRAFSKIKGKPTMIIPGSGLRKEEKLPVREGMADQSSPADKKTTTRDVIDLMRAANGYAFIACACGLKMKVPPDFEDSKIECPRCHRQNEVPLAVLAGVGAVLEATQAGMDASSGETPSPQSKGTGAKEPPLEYERRGKGWESFTCSCGKLQQLSPAFSGFSITCRHCARIIKIV